MNATQVACSKETKESREVLVSLEVVYFFSSQVDIHSRQRGLWK